MNNFLWARLQPERTGRLCAQVVGFSLHAAVYCKPWERKKLEILCRYITRPAVAEERIEMKPSGDIVLRLKTPYRDGTRHLLFSGLEFEIRPYPTNPLTSPRPEARLR